MNIACGRLRPISYLIITGRSFGAGVPAINAAPTLSQMIALTDKLSRLLPDDAGWSRALMRAAMDMFSSQSVAEAGGNATGQFAPGRANPTARNVVGRSTGANGGFCTTFDLLTDTLAFLFPGVHVRYYSQVGEWLEALRGVDFSQGISCLAACWRRAATSSDSLALLMPRHIPVRPV